MDDRQSGQYFDFNAYGNAGEAYHKHELSYFLYAIEQKFKGMIS